MVHLPITRRFNLCLLSVLFAALPLAGALTAAGGDTIPFNTGLSGLPGASATPGIGTTPGSVNLVFDASAFSALSAGSTYAGVLAVSWPRAANGGRAGTTVVLDGVGCSYTLGSSGSLFDTTGGNGTFSVTAGATCDWTASSSATWVAITSIPAGTGNGVVDFAVMPNGSALTRSATISVADQSYVITQFGQSCSYAIDPVSMTVPSSGGQAMVHVWVSASVCLSWTATSNAP